MFNINQVFSSLTNFKYLKSRPAQDSTNCQEPDFLKKIGFDLSKNCPLVINQNVCGMFGLFV